MSHAKKLIADAYDRVASGWDRHIVPATAAVRERLLDLARLKPGERVLEVGAGTGSTALLAARRIGRKGFVLGIDMSPEMLARARRKAAQSGLKHVEFRLMDACSLDLPDESFDVVISSWGNPDPPDDARAAVLEWRRALVPGGRLCHCGEGGGYKLFPLFDQMFEEYKVRNPTPELAEKRRLAARVAEEAKRLPSFDPDDAARVVRLIESAGFVNVQPLAETFAVKLPARALLDLLLTASKSNWPFAAEYAALSREARDQFRRQVRDALRPLERSGRLTETVKVNFLLGSKL